MKFKKDFLLELLETRENVIKDEIFDESRWSIIHSLLFAHDGKFYKTIYSVGATERQDESPWEYDPEEIECKEVFKKES